MKVTFYIKVKGKSCPTLYETGNDQENLLWEEVGQKDFKGCIKKGRVDFTKSRLSLMNVKLLVALAKVISARAILTDNR